MSEPRTYKLQLIATASRPDPDNVIENNGSVVIIGANGSGKTRLGSWIEFDSTHKSICHRISAQKSLNMPLSVLSSSLDVAKPGLLYGHETAGNLAHKRNHRWRDQPNTFLLDDFQKLLTFLFAEESDTSIKYRLAAKAGPLSPPPETNLDIVKRIWERTLPHRELVISGGKVETRVKGHPSTIYNAAEMSDGERVVFYLIGQCLAAPADGVIIIDEPELHLHRSIQAKLWDEVESLRKDCMFVYLTHDLDFAASRLNSKKIWLKSFDGSTWDWDLVPESDTIPEDVMLSILGSRKPVVFIEGTPSSWDYFLFTHLYPSHTITPAHNCDAVIHATRSFYAMKHLHTLECYGIIDRDYRNDGQVAYLKTLNVHTLEISEIENLLIVEGVFRAVARHLRRAAEADVLFERYKGIVLNHLATDKERVISSLAAAEIEASFKKFDNKATGQTGLADSLNRVLGGINVAAIYARAAAKVEVILASHDYAEAIKIYNNKGLVAKAAQVFGITNDVYQNFLKSLIIDPEATDVAAAMKPYLPDLPLPASGIVAASPAAPPLPTAT